MELLAVDCAHLDQSGCNALDLPPDSSRLQQRTCTASGVIQQQCRLHLVAARFAERKDSCGVSVAAAVSAPRASAVATSPAMSTCNLSITGSRLEPMAPSVPGATQTADTGAMDTRRKTVPYRQNSTAWADSWMASVRGGFRMAVRDAESGIGASRERCEDEL